MARMPFSTLPLVALAASAAAQTITSAATTSAAASGSVVDFTFPGGLDKGTYVGSLIGSANSLTTILVGCPEGTSEKDCDFYPPVPITANPSTIKAAFTYGTTFTYYYNCAMSTGGATCVASATGIEAEFVSGSATSGLTQITSASSTDVYNATDIVSYPITLLSGNPTGQFAGLGAVTTGASNGTASSGLSTISRNSTVSSTSSHSSSGTTFHASSTSTSSRASSTAASSTSSGGASDVAALAPGFFAAALMGMAAVLL